MEERIALLETKLDLIDKKTDILTEHVEYLYNASIDNAKMNAKVGNFALELGKKIETLKEENAQLLKLIDELRG